MKCHNCQGEVNPTLVYCVHCGLPLDVEVEDVIADEEAKLAERRMIEAVQKAKGLLVLSLFLFGATIAARMVLLKEQHYDHFPAYRVPYRVVAEEGIEPPVALDVPTLPVPLPE